MIFRKLSIRSVVHRTFFTILLESVRMSFLIIATHALKTILKSEFFWGEGKLEKVENHKAWYCNVLD